MPSSSDLTFRLHRLIRFSFILIIVIGYPKGGFVNCEHDQGLDTNSNNGSHDQTIESEHKEQATESGTQDGHDEDKGKESDKAHDQDTAPIPNEIGTNRGVNPLTTEEKVNNAKRVKVPVVVSVVKNTSTTTDTKVNNAGKIKLPVVYQLDKSPQKLETAVDKDKNAPPQTPKPKARLKQKRPMAVDQPFDMNTENREAEFTKHQELEVDPDTNETTLIQNKEFLKKGSKLYQNTTHKFKMPLFLHGGQKKNKIKTNSKISPNKTEKVKVPVVIIKDKTSKGKSITNLEDSKTTEENSTLSKSDKQEPKIARLKKMKPMAVDQPFDMNTENREAEFIKHQELEVDPDTNETTLIQDKEFLKKGTKLYQNTTHKFKMPLFLHGGQKKNKIKTNSKISPNKTEKVKAPVVIIKDKNSKGKSIPNMEGSENTDENSIPLKSDQEQPSEVASLKKIKRPLAVDKPFEKITEDPEVKFKKRQELKVDPDTNDTTLIQDKEFLKKVTKNFQNNTHKLKLPAAFHGGQKKNKIKVPSNGAAPNTDSNDTKSESQAGVENISDQLPNKISWSSTTDPNSTNIKSSTKASSSKKISKPSKIKKPKPIDEPFEKITEDPDVKFKKHQKLEIDPDTNDTTLVQNKEFLKKITKNYQNNTHKLKLPVVFQGGQKKKKIKVLAKEDTPNDDSNDTLSESKAGVENSNDKVPNKISWSSTKDPNSTKIKSSTKASSSNTISKSSKVKKPMAIDEPFEKITKDPEVKFKKNQELEVDPDTNDTTLIQSKKFLKKISKNYQNNTHKLKLPVVFHGGQKKNKVKVPPKGDAENGNTNDTQSESEAGVENISNQIPNKISWSSTKDPNSTKVKSSTKASGTSKTSSSTKIKKPTAVDEPFEKITEDREVEFKRNQDPAEDPSSKDATQTQNKQFLKKITKNYQNNTHKLKLPVVFHGGQKKNKNKVPPEGVAENADTNDTQSQSEAGVENISDKVPNKISWSSTKEPNSTKIKSSTKASSSNTISKPSKTSRPMAIDKPFEKISENPEVKFKKNQELEIEPDTNETTLIQSKKFLKKISKNYQNNTHKLELPVVYHGGQKKNKVKVSPKGAAENADTNDTQSEAGVENISDKVPNKISWSSTKDPNSTKVKSSTKASSTIKISSSPKANKPMAIDEPFEKLTEDREVEFKKNQTPEGDPNSTDATMTQSKQFLKKITKNYQNNTHKLKLPVVFHGGQKKNKLKVPPKGAAQNSDSNDTESQSQAGVENISDQLPNKISWSSTTDPNSTNIKSSTKASSSKKISKPSKTNKPKAIDEPFEKISENPEVKFKKNQELQVDPDTNDTTLIQDKEFLKKITKNYQNNTHKLKMPMVLHGGHKKNKIKIPTNTAGKVKIPVVIIEDKNSKSESADNSDGSKNTEENGPTSKPDRKQEPHVAPLTKMNRPIAIDKPFEKITKDPEVKFKKHQELQVDPDTNDTTLIQNKDFLKKITKNYKNNTHKLKSPVVIHGGHKKNKIKVPPKGAGRNADSDSNGTQSQSQAGVENMNDKLPNKISWSTTKDPNSTNIKSSTKASGTTKTSSSPKANKPMAIDEPFEKITEDREVEFKRNQNPEVDPNSTDAQLPHNKQFLKKITKNYQNNTHKLKLPVVFHGGQMKNEIKVPSKGTQAAPNPDSKDTQSLSQAGVDNINEKLPNKISWSSTKDPNSTKVKSSTKASSSNTVSSSPSKPIKSGRAAFKLPRPVEEAYEVTKVDKEAEYKKAQVLKQNDKTGEIKVKETREFNKKIDVKNENNTHKRLQTVVQYGGQNQKKNKVQGKIHTTTIVTPPPANNGNLKPKSGDFDGDDEKKNRGPAIKKPTRKRKCRPRQRKPAKPVPIIAGRSAIAKDLKKPPTSKDKKHDSKHSPISKDKKPDLKKKENHSSKGKDSVPKKNSGSKDSIKIVKPEDSKKKDKKYGTKTGRFALGVGPHFEGTTQRPDLKHLAEILQSDSKKGRLSLSDIKMPSVANAKDKMSKVSSTMPQVSLPKEIKNIQAPALIAGKGIKTIESPALVPGKEINLEKPSSVSKGEDPKGFKNKAPSLTPKNNIALGKSAIGINKIQKDEGFALDPNSKIAPKKSNEGFLLGKSPSIHPPKDTFARPAQGLNGGRKNFQNQAPSILPQSDGGAVVLKGYEGQNDPNYKGSSEGLPIKTVVERQKVIFRVKDSDAVRKKKDRVKGKNAGELGKGMAQEDPEDEDVPDLNTAPVVNPSLSNQNASRGPAKIEARQTPPPPVALPLPFQRRKISWRTDDLADSNFDSQLNDRMIPGQGQGPGRGVNRSLNPNQNQNPFASGKIREKLDGEVKPEVSKADVPVVAQAPAPRSQVEMHDDGHHEVEPEEAEHEKANHH